MQNAFVQSALRYGTGWVVAAAAAVSLSWTVISDAVNPDRLGRSTGSASAPVPADRTVIGSPIGVTVPAGSGPVTASGAVVAPGTTAGRATSTTASTTSTTAGGTRTGSPVTGRGTVTPKGTSPGSGPAVPGPTASTPGTAAPTSSTGPSSTSHTSPPAAGTSSSSGVRSYQVTGGQVVLRLGESSATLVTATPAAGHRVQTWEAEGWLRVDFSAGATTVSSVFATWNGHPPSVETVEY